MMQRAAMVGMVLLCGFIGCSSDRAPVDDTPPSTKTRAEKSAPPVYFPPESQPRRAPEITLDALLEEYITPHLTITQLEPWDESLRGLEGAIAIRFNYPMVDDARINAPLREGIWSFVPYREGTYQWVDAKTLSFRPDRAWESGDVRGIVSTAAQSLNGYRLLATYEAAIDNRPEHFIAGKLVDWEVTAGSPRLIVIDPPLGKTIGPRQGISLVFDQPTLLSAMRGRLSLGLTKDRGRDVNQTLPTRILHPQSPVINGVPVDPAYVVMIEPRAPLSFESEVTITFGAGVKAAEAIKATYTTPAPLRLLSITCQRGTTCDIAEGEDRDAPQHVSNATGYLRLQFSDDLAEIAKNFVTIAPTPEASKIEVIGTELFVSWQWLPNHRYTIQLESGFQSVHRTALAAGATLDVSTRHLLPALEVPVGLKTLDRNKGTAFALKWRNVSQMVMKRYAVTGDNIAQYMDWIWSTQENGNLIAEPKIGKPHLFTYRGNPTGNQWDETPITLDQLRADTDAHIFFLRYETTPFVPQSPETAKRLEAMIQVTDIGLVAKHLPTAMFVAATSLTTGTAIPNLRLSLLTGDGAIAAQETTGTDGTARIPTADLSSEDMPRLLLAEADEDTAFLWLGSKSLSTHFFELDPTLTQSFDDAAESHTAMRAMLFTDKGIYKSGQTVHLKGWIIAASDVEQLQLHIIDPLEDEVHAATLDIINHGFDLDWELSSKLKHGAYQLRLTAGDTRIAQTGVQITDFEKTAFTVSVESPTIELPQKAPWHLTVNADYLFGMPVARGTLAWELFVSPVEFAPKGFEAYLFRNSTAWIDTDGVEDKTQKEMSFTGGTATLQIETATQTLYANVPTPLEHILNVTVTDDAGTAVSSQARTVVTPMEYFVGLEQRYDYNEHEPLTFEWVALSPQAKILEGVQATATLYKLTDHWFQEEGLRDSYYVESDTEQKSVATCVTISTTSRKGCRLGPQPAGRYALTLESTDAQGTKVSSGYELFIIGEGVVSQRESKTHLLKFSTDKHNYHPGETAKIQFANPFPVAKALVTIERDTLLYHTVVEVDEGVVQIPIPLRADYAPNVFVGVHLIVPRRGNIRDGVGNDASEPTYLSGYQPLYVDLAPKRLRVRLSTPKERYEPREKVSLALELQDSAGAAVKAGNVALFVVDEGALALTDYQTPAPLAAFYPLHKLAVRVADNRTQAYSTNYRLTVMEKGQIMGDGMSAPAAELAQIRQDFPDTIYWNPNVTTDAEGKAAIDFTLPDSTTAFRVMAVAHDGSDRFGHSDLGLTAALPLFAEPVLPSFLMRGDIFEAKIRLQNTTDTEQRVTVTMQSPSQKTTTITVPATNTRVARFSLPVPEESDEAMVHITLTSAQWKDAVKKTLPIHPPYREERRQITGTFRGKQVVKLRRPTDWDNADHLTLRLSTLPFADFGLGLRYLLQYPYGCVEQTSSGLIALLAATDDLKDLLPDGTLKEQATQAKVQAGVERLASMAVDGGGLAYWPGRTDAHIFGSIYGFMALQKAAAAGVDHSVTTQLKNTLTTWARAGKSDEETALSRTHQALLLFALAEAGEKPDALASRLLEQSETLDTVALAMTMRGLRLMGRRKDATGLVPHLESHFDATGKLTKQPTGYAYFGSTTRDSALALLAFLAVDEDHALVEPLVRRLFAAQVGGRWGNTQETVYGLLAIGAYLQSSRAGTLPSLTIRAGDATFTEKDLKSVGRVFSETRIPFAPEGKITIATTTSTSLYYSINAHYRRTFTPADNRTLHEGLQIFRTIEDRDGREVTTNQLQEGELYRWRIYVQAEAEIPYFFLDYALPAGTAPLNTGLATTASVDLASEDEESAAEGDRRYLLHNRGRAALSHQEIHTDRVLFFADALPEGLSAFDFYARATHAGNYLQPPAIAGGMYSEALRGTLATEKISINK